MNPILILYFRKSYMRNLIVSAVLALGALTAFAQPVNSPYPALSESGSSGLPTVSPKEHARQMAVLSAPFLGILPELQVLCGHTDARKARVKAALENFERSIGEQFGNATLKEYQSGVAKGRSMFKGQGKIDPSKVKQACEQIDSSLEASLVQMEASTTIADRPGSAAKPEPPAKSVKPAKRASAAGAK